MFNKMLNKTISKITKENYEIDKNITLSVVLSQINKRIMMVLRGIIKKPFFKKAKGTLFIGKRCDIKCKKLIKLNGSATIEDYVKIDALSKHGIEIGKNFSIGRNSIITYVI